MFWSCQSLNIFWSLILECFSSLSNTTLEPNPLSAIFDVVQPVDSFCLIGRQKAHHLFLKWSQEVMSMLKLEKVRYTVRGSKQKFDETWSLSINYLKLYPSDWIISVYYVNWFVNPLSVRDKAGIYYLSGASLSHEKSRACWALLGRKQRKKTWEMHAASWMQWAVPTWLLVCRCGIWAGGRPPGCDRSAWWRWWWASQAAKRCVWPRCIPPSDWPRCWRGREPHSEVPRLRGRSLREWQVIWHEGSICEYVSDWVYTHNSLRERIRKKERHIDV